MPSKPTKTKSARVTAGIPPEQTRALLSRLRRAEGQVRAVIRQIEEGQPCEQVAQQLTAARKALDKAFFAMAGCAIEHGQVEPRDVSAFLAKFV